ncbi:MAG: TetR/AcrR family transcriptional regulator [bacterium]|nr:TetR/AcrR family transcriptional regulator [bacterium]
MAQGKAVKEHIISVTTDLILQYDGDIDHITARMIAGQADIALGLINYHFGSKENLITECVQRIVGKVVSSFQMTQTFETDKERLTAWAVSVFDFLFEHSAMAHISILADLQNYTARSNSVLTQRGFLFALKNDVADEDRAILAFTLLSAMQTAFLGNETAALLLGYDFNKKEDRAAYITKLVNVLFDGAGPL